MLVVDASIAAKWAFHEHDSDRAIALVADVETLAAPSLILAEVSNVGGKLVRRGTWEAADVHEGVSIVLGMLNFMAPLEELWEDALRLSIQADHPIYDCFYVALALRENAQLVTADRRMAAMAEAVGIGVVSL
jgi:predicted nucleic acid-binding protein